MDYLPLEDAKLYKSNTLISAKYKSTLIENQITAIALTRIQQKIVDNKSELIAEIYPSEIKRIIGGEANIYRTLKVLRNQMQDRKILYEDGKGNFKSSVIITDADYQDGVFIVRFNDRIRPMISNLESKFTTLELSVLTGLEHNSSYRLYELFKKELYDTNPRMINGEVHLEYNISELKFLLGICDIGNPEIENLRNRMGNNIDYDELYSKLDKKQRKYERWNDFEKRVIMPAQEELEIKSNIRFVYEGIKTKGKKIGKIRFIVSSQEISDREILQKEKYIKQSKKEFNDKKLSADRQLEIPMDINMEFYDEFVGHQTMSKEDIDMLLNAAGMDTELVKQAIYYVDERPDVHTNYVGYVKTVIEHPEWLNREIYIHNGEVVNPELTKAAKSIQRDIKNNPEKYDKMTWERIMQKEDFNEFLEYMQSNMYIDYDTLDLVYSYRERNEFYKNWKLGNRN